MLLTKMGGGNQKPILHFCWPSISTAWHHTLAMKNVYSGHLRWATVKCVETPERTWSAWTRKRKVWKVAESWNSPRPIEETHQSHHFLRSSSSQRLNALTYSLPFQHILLIGSSTPRHNRRSAFGFSFPRTQYTASYSPRPTTPGTDIYTEWE
jgi:hypothetical protein